ncbi:ricin-type beta-trefoil lectin domain protein [Streptomyces sp. NPDC001851]|uniref:ricin-type beta-trefoil lectin domain protein n=1 Tax=Streptomyces sp. NPDC001851 TaxID=3154529 RepID=UPI00331899E2
MGRPSGKCLAADASGAVIASRTGAAGQSWPYDAQGTLKGTNGCPTAEGPGLAAGATATGDAARRRPLNSNGRIVDEAAGRCLDVSGQATADGGKVILHNGGGSEAWTRR